MENNYFDKYHDLKDRIEDMRIKRRDEILKELKEKNNAYADIIKERSSQSMILRNKLSDDIDEFEKYMDLIYEQEIYELDAVYVNAFYDAIKMLKDMA